MDDQTYNEIDIQLKTMPKPTLSHEQKERLHSKMQAELLHPSQSKKQNLTQRWAVSVLTFSFLIVFIVWVTSVTPFHKYFLKHSVTHSNTAQSSVLTKAEGGDFVYSEFFKTVDQLDKRQDGIFYQPVSFDQILTVMPTRMNKVVHLLDKEQLPFKVNREQAYLVTSKLPNGSLQHEVQFSYLNQSAMGEFPKQFFNISITELNHDPFSKIKPQAIKNKDSFGNRVIKETLTNNVPIYHQIITTPSALVYSFYGYNQKSDKVISMVTTANEFYTYYKGYVIHIGYNSTGKYNKIDEEKMLNLVRQFIMGKEN